MKHAEILVITTLTILSLILSSTSISQGYIASSNSSGINVGPYVDSVIYRVIDYQYDRVLALLSGQVDMDFQRVDSYYLSSLESDPDISIFSAYRDGYGHVTINCAKYPLNISGFRRAFAFAFNKTKVTEYVMGGLSIEHDSLVPLPNSWCAEDEFDWHYYTAQPDIGNQILDELNFTIDSKTGYRLAPNGSQFEIVMEYSSTGLGGHEVSDIVVEALHSLFINASAQSVGQVELYNTFSNHEDYDMYFYSTQFNSNDVRWLAYDYWSEYTDVYRENPSNFANDTYDNWRDQLLCATSYEDVYEAAVEMQKILHYNVPRLVVYENIYFQAYRNDQFTGHVDDLEYYISGPWTLRKIHRLDGTLGGTISIAYMESIATYNIFVVYSTFTDYNFLFLNLWPSLFKTGPGLTPITDLAETMIIETHSDNQDVPIGHTRFTIDMVKNATWSDGIPLTAEDVALTFTYYLESIEFGNPVGQGLDYLVAAYAKNPYCVVFEFSTESYWHFNDFAYKYIIPYHIFNETTGIHYDEWNVWDPVYNTTHPHVTCGPFVFHEYDKWESFEISRNELFHYLPTNIDDSETSTTSTIISTTSTTTETNPTNSNGVQSIDPIRWSLVISSVIAIPSSIVIMYCVIIIRKNKVKEN